MMHVTSVHLECFRGMFQLFHMDAAIVDWDVPYVAMVVHVLQVSVPNVSFAF